MKELGLGMSMVLLKVALRTLFPSLALLLASGREMVGQLLPLAVISSLLNLGMVTMQDFSNYKDKRSMASIGLLNG